MAEKCRNPSGRCSSVHCFGDGVCRARDASGEPMPAVGDVHSNQPGSGARYNAGKVPFETIPVWIVDAYFHSPDHYVKAHEDGVAAGRRDVAKEVLRRLGEWQGGRLGVLDVLRSFPFGVIEEAARVFKYACTEKVNPYPMWNWARGMPWSVPTACAVRHLSAVLRGEEADKETGLPHLGHAACNIIMLAQYEYSYREGDDRPKEIRKQFRAADLAGMLAADFTGDGGRIARSTTDAIDWKTWKD